MVSPSPMTQRSPSRPAMPRIGEPLLDAETRSVSPIGTAVAASAAGMSGAEFEALERAAEKAQTPFMQKVQEPQPPPPASATPRRTPSSRPAPASYKRSISPVPGARRTPVPPNDPNASPGRYGQSRPAAVFANRPAEGMSIFGEDLISEKSLDEVILSYLAEDLDSADKK